MAAAVVVAAAVFAAADVARKAVGDLKDEWARKTMLEHCDDGSAVVLVAAAAVVVVSEDMVDDVRPWASAFASLGVQALGAHQGNYCFGYYSSCLDAEDAAVTCDNFHRYQVPSHPFEDLLVQQGHRVRTRELRLTQHPAFLAFLDVLAVMASYPNAAFYRTWQDASAFFVAAVGPS